MSSRCQQQSRVSVVGTSKARRSRKRHEGSTPSVPREQRSAKRPIVSRRTGTDILPFFSFLRPLRDAAFGRSGLRPAPLADRG
jgi:hypothetical protein